MTDQMQLVKTVNSSDVLAGRGNGPNKHAGNIVFRQIVADKREDYSRSSNKEKQKVIEEVVGHITNKEGRFLSEQNNEGERYILDLKEIKRKTAQALREKPKNNNATGDNVNNNATGDNVLPTEVDLPQATDHSSLRGQSKDRNVDIEAKQAKDQNVDIEAINNRHLEKKFNWETLKNGNDDSLSDSIVDELMASRVSMGFSPLTGLRSRYQGHENEENMSMSMSIGNWEMKYDEQSVQSNSANTKDESDEPWSTSLPPNQSLPPNFFSEIRETQHVYGKIFTPSQSIPPSNFTENQKHDNDNNKINEQCLSSQTKKIDSCNKNAMKKIKEKNCSKAPNSDQSDIPMKYTRLMREAIISWKSRRNLEVDDEDDESKDNTARIKAINGINKVKSDQSSVGPHETDHPFDMSLASVVQPSDLNENREAMSRNEDRFTLRKSIFTWKGLLSMSQRKLLSNEDDSDDDDGGGDGDESDDAQTIYGHEMRTNDGIHENSDQPLSPNPSADNYFHAARNDTNEMSCSSLFSIERIKKVFQNEKEDCSLNLNDSVSDFSFDSNLTDDESDDKPHENFCSDMREMMAKFKSMSKRNLIAPY